MSTDAHEELGVTGRRIVITVVVGIVLAVSALGLIAHAADYHTIVEAVRNADHAWLPLCVLGELVAYAGYILAYHDLARADGGPCLRTWDVTRVVAVGFGAFVVGSGFGGLAVDFWALRRAGARGHEATRRVLALNTLEWGVLAVAATAASIVVLVWQRGNAPLPMALAWLVLTPACIAAAIWVSSPARADRLAALGRRCPRPHGLDLRGWTEFVSCALRRGFSDAVGGLVLIRHILHHPHRYWRGLLGYPIYWAGDVLALSAGLRAFDAHVPLEALLLAYATGYVATSLPLPAGGSGGIEASLTLCLTLVDIPLASAILGVLVYRFFTFWLPILPALLFLPTLRSLARDLPRRAREGGAREAGWSASGSRP